MNSSLQHLADIKQAQILQITEVIKKFVHPKMIILFGSYAKGRQVEHRYTGKDGIHYEYVSDYDILVVTQKNELKEYELEDIINNTLSHIAPSINLQIHEIDYINEGLAFGQYFFTDIINEGIVLYDTGNVSFAPQLKLTPQEEKQKAQRYFDIWFPQALQFIKGARFHLTDNAFKVGAFSLHQATESLYYATLLTFTGYKPKTHNLAKLRKQSKLFSEELFICFPIETDKKANYLFDLLKRSYIEARYKPDYEINNIELDELITRVDKMQNIVRTICSNHIASI